MNDIEKRAHAVQAAMNHKVGGITPAKYLHLNEAQWAEVVDVVTSTFNLTHFSNFKLTHLS